MEVLLDQIVHTDYGIFTLEWGPDTWDGHAERFFAGQVNGWVGAAVPDSVFVNLARRAGGSTVRFEMHEFAPEVDPTAEDIVEVSIRVPDGVQPSWGSFAMETSGDIKLPSGAYRLRVSARGRDAGVEDEFMDETASEVIDWYRLQAWPAEGAPDAVLRTTSWDANYWNRTWGSRRTT